MQRKPSRIPDFFCTLLCELSRVYSNICLVANMVNLKAKKSKLYLLMFPSKHVRQFCIQNEYDRKQIEAKRNVMNQIWRNEYDTKQIKANFN